MQHDQETKEAFADAGQPLVIDHFSADTMDLLVDRLYGEFKQDVPFDLRVAMYAASHRYDIPELQQECERVLADCVTSQTHCQLAVMASLFGSCQLKQVALPSHLCMYAVHGAQLVHTLLLRDVTNPVSTYQLFLLTVFCCSIL